MDLTIQCKWCLLHFKEKGLGRHLKFCKKRPSSCDSSQNSACGTLQADDNEETPLDALLANLKAHTKILKRVPRGARVAVAEALAGCIEACVSDNTTATWTRLLTFAYNCLRVPERKPDRQVSLATEVKRNVNCFLNEAALPFESQRSTPRNKITTDKLRAKLVETKVSEGDIKGAIRVMCSEDVFAPMNLSTLEDLRLLHPPANEPSEYPPEPNSDIYRPLVVNESQVRGALRTFPVGSAGGLDALRPQHFKDLITKNVGVAGDRLVSALTNLCNVMLNGKVPHNICPILYGASLCALGKKTGGVRPIAVGNFFRRTVAKLGCNHISEKIGRLLRPVQLGFGTLGGAEAIVHTARRFIDHSHKSTKAFLKLDFANAFNTLRRDRLLQVVSTELPDLYPFIYQCYRIPSSLAFGEEIILSQNGVQQGDPLGPGLFCLSVHEMTKSLSSEINLWYLDDGSLGDCPEVVLRDSRKLIELAGGLGLQLNTKKCEVLIVRPDSSDSFNYVEQFESALPGIKVLSLEESTLLGAPITTQAIAGILDKKIRELQRMKQRLSSVSAHCGFFLLKNSQSIPKLAYLLRCSPSWKEEVGLKLFDDALKSAMEAVSNTLLEKDAWVQLSLPVEMGGMGVRQAMNLALPAFLSSSQSVCNLVKSLLPDYISNINDVLFSEGVTMWKCITSSETTTQNNGGRSQREWERPIMESLREKLVERTTSPEGKARLLAVSSKESGAWINAIPSSSIGTFLDDNAFRVAFALRLGSSICRPHLCPCGAAVDETGLHGLRCVKSAGRHSRHGAVNDIIKRALTSASVPAVLEPPGLSRDDGKRPDGMSLVPWSNGRAMIWDFTCVDTLAASNINSALTITGGAATSAENRKKNKYRDLSNRYMFCPIAVETFGSFGLETLQIVKSIGRKIREFSGEARSTSYLIQRISIAVQRGNAVSVLGTIPQGSSLSDFISLL